jgi:hypothetical protein
MAPRTRDRLLVLGWIAWACFVLSHYYVQVVRAAALRRLPSGSEAMAAAIPILLLAFIPVVMRWMFSRRPPSARRTPWALNGPRAAVLFCALGVVTVPWLLVRDLVAPTLSGRTIGGFPWIGEAVARGGIAVIGAILIASAALGAGAVVLRLIGWRTTSRLEHVIFAAVTGVGVVSYGSLALAWMGMYRPMAVAVLIALLLLGAAPLARTIGEIRLPLREMAGVSAVTAMWLALTAVALGYGLIAALAPEKEYDALWYHLQLPRLWLEAGRPIDIVEEYISLYPLTWELVFGAGMVLGGTIGAKLLHFVCLPLIALLVSHAARTFVSGVSPAAVAALVVTTPTLLWEASTAYVDLALALHAAAACYALARYAQHGGRAWGAVAALQFGLAAATKHLGVFITIIALALFVLSALRSQSVRLTLRRALVIALVAAVVPAPWYIRSWSASGNPVFPEMFAVFGASPPDRWDVFADQGLAQFKAHFGRGRSLRDLVMLPWDVTVHGALFGGSLGPLFLVLLPALLFARQRAVLRWLALGVVAYIAVWALPVSSFQLRFLMPVVPPLALLAAAAFDNIGARAQSLRHGKAVVTIAVLGLAVINLPPFTPLHEADRAGWNGWLTHVIREAPARVVAGRESEAVYLRREVTSFGAWEVINAKLDGDVRILTFSGGDHVHARRPRVSHDATTARPAVWGTPAENIAAAVAALRRLGITHVLFDRRELSRLNADSLAITAPEMRQACASEFDDGRYWLCRLNYTRLAVLDAVGAR